MVLYKNKPVGVSTTETVGLKSIRIVKPPHILTYLKNIPFHPEGMSVQAELANGVTFLVSQEALSFDPPLTSGLTTGVTGVTVRFQLGDVAAEAIQPIKVLSTSSKFGVRWDYGKPETALTRVTGSVAAPSPAVGAGKGTSPFDNYLPWKGMEEYNIIDGRIAYKQGDDGFSRTLYDTVVYIPEYYARIYDDPKNKQRFFYVSNAYEDGYFRHPGSGRFIGRYQAGYTGDQNYMSRSGQKPYINTSLDTARGRIKNKGTHWSLYDYTTWCAVWLLYLVEFADWDSQTKLGLGITNGSIQASGTTDSMVYHTGRAADADTGNTAVQYRHIENVFGNAFIYPDGINIYNRSIYVSNSPEDNQSNTSKNHIKSDVLLSNNSSRTYIDSLGFSDLMPWAFIPTSAAGSENTYIPDTIAIGSSDNNWYTPAICAYATIGGKAGGLFQGYWNYTSTTAYSDRGFRLQFNPPAEEIQTENASLSNEEV